MADAAAEAIESGHVAGAALDVFAKEPVTESPLFELEEVVVTPHLGASTREAQDKAGTTVAEMVHLALKGEFVPYAVNVSAGAEVTEVVRPFVPLAERTLPQALREAGILVKNLHGGHPLLQHCLRITVGTPQQNDALLAALKELRP